MGSVTRSRKFRCSAEKQEQNPKKEAHLQKGISLPQRDPATELSKGTHTQLDLPSKSPISGRSLQPGQGITAGGQSLRQGPDIAHVSKERTGWTILTCPQEADGESRHTAHHPSPPLGSNTSGKKPSAHCLGLIPTFQQKIGGPLTAQPVPLPGSLPDMEPKNTDPHTHSFRPLFLGNLG